MTGLLKTQTAQHHSTGEVLSSSCYYTVRQKKLHRFIFAIALSELHLLWQYLVHVYTNKFSIICILYRAVWTCLGALGPPGWWGPYHPYGPRGGVGPLCSVPANPAIHTKVSIRVRHDIKLLFTKWGLTCFDMPKCMKTGVTCTLHKNYKTSQLERSSTP